MTPPLGTYLDPNTRAYTHTHIYIEDENVSCHIWWVDIAIYNLSTGNTFLFFKINVWLVNNYSWRAERVHKLCSLCDI